LAWRHPDEPAKQPREVSLIGKAAAMATWLSGVCGTRINVCARSMRRRITNSRGDSPKVFLQARAKWLQLSLTSDARSPGSACDRDFLR
jgi:hypothetical protein